MLILPFLIFIFSLTWSVYSLYALPTPPPLVEINRPWPSPLPSPSPTPTPKPQIQGVIVSTSNISEASLFQALVNYRHGQNRSSIVFEPNLCPYARKRAQAHVDRFKNLSSGESPLDNHAGFQADAVSQSLFSETGDSYSAIAEVLAYIPQAKTATQVIEWGWDSSPSHRETLLSNDMTHACLAGIHPFYVGILAH